jgi:Polyketide cyclase / dehydrase and lipid transport
MGQVMKLVGIGILAATLLVAVVGLLLPSEYRVQRELVIHTSPERIHQFTSDLETWPQWTPWFQNDPSLEITIGPISRDVGAHQEWKAKKGGGHLTITRSEPRWGVGYEMDLSKGRPQSNYTMRYEAMADSTKVIWEMQGDMGWNLMGRYFNLLMDPMVGPLFDEGLARLKMITEKPPADNGS